jgi:Kdo2-lipid IVA lauroyltransferase/acyltransferase
VISLFPTRDRQVARLQLARHFPHLDAAKTCSLVYRHIGETALESLNVTPLLNNGSIRCDNDEWIHRLRSTGKGAVALSAHLGNWELLAAYVSSRGFNLAAIGQVPRKSALQPVLESLRTRNNVGTLWRSASGGAKAVIGHLKKGGLVAAVIDQDTRVDSVSAPFFGIPAKTPSAIISMALRLDLPITTAFSTRRPDGGFNIYFEEIVQRDSPEVVLAEYHRRLEALIRECPEQWVWFHKRWRTLPDGTTLSSRDYIAKLTAELRERNG